MYSAGFGYTILSFLVAVLVVPIEVTSSECGAKLCPNCLRLLLFFFGKYDSLGEICLSTNHINDCSSFCQPGLSRACCIGLPRLFLPQSIKFSLCKIYQNSFYISRKNRKILRNDCKISTFSHSSESERKKLNFRLTKSLILCSDAGGDN